MRRPSFVQPDELVPPLFHFSDDLVVFDSLTAMTQYIEPWDVRESDRAFDAQGRRIVLLGVGVKRTRWSVGGGETVFDADSSGENAPARGADPAFDFAGVWTVPSRPEPTSTELLLESYRAEGGPFDDTFDARRVLYRVADLHSALAHFVVTDRPDLLHFAVQDLWSTLRQLHTVA